ncbi:MAG TPA: hypothetical protein VFI49_06865 [Rudaea sp.]|nr:hypothetical protein [Rudaea sp.]
MGTATTDLVLTAPAWRRWLLLTALFVLGAAYIAAYALFVARSRNFIDVQRNERAETFAHAHAIAVPAHVTFGEGQPGAGMLGGGWYNPETGGAWSASADAWIHLALTTSDSDLELQLNATAFVAEHHSRIRIGVDVNDASLGSWERRPDNAGEPMRAHIPAAQARSGSLIVHLHIDKPASPKQLGPSDDFRQLGVFLTSLDLTVPPNVVPVAISR